MFLSTPFLEGSVQRVYSYEPHVYFLVTTWVPKGFREARGVALQSRRCTKSGRTSFAVGIKLVQVFSRVSLLVTFFFLSAKWL